MVKNSVLRISACCNAVSYHKRITLKEILDKSPVVWYCGVCNNIASTYVKPEYLEISKGIYRKIQYNG